MKNIGESGRNPYLWTAGIYSAELDSYIDVTLVLSEDDELIVSTTEGGDAGSEVLRLVAAPVPRYVRSCG